MTRRAVPFTVDGRAVAPELDGDERLLDVLRDRLGRLGTHAGCHEGVCGSCTVLLDGEPVRSCLLLAIQAEGCRVTTVEGLAVGGALSPLQAAFVEHGAAQCGFCTGGMLVSATALLAATPHPTREAVVDGLAGNLCRCTGYVKIVDAVLAAAEVAGGEPAAGQAPA